MKNQQTLIPHVVIFPLPFQGPVNCALKLAELLCNAGIQVTFINTDHIQRRLLLHTNIQSRFDRYPNFRFMTISDGLPDDHPRSADRFMDMINGWDALMLPVFREMVTTGELSRGKSSERPVSCIISDGWYWVVSGIAEEIGVPLVYFDTISPGGIWASLCLPRMIEAGEVPFEGNDLDELIKNVPGMESYLRRRDLPSFCRTGDINDPIAQIILKEAKHLPRCKGLILNTFKELEEPLLSHFRTLFPNLYTIGPLHALFTSRLPPPPEPPQPGLNSSNSLWEEDRQCMAWLDSQAPKSVIFISVGSLAMMTEDQLIEFWYGLVNSGKKFLWIRRPGSVAGDESKWRIPEDLLEGTKERGLIVNWAPQEEVLAHWAVGGFLTHCGWNSTLESIVAGKPMICWPYFVDQQVNSRLVAEVWKVGIDMKDTCDRVIIEKKIKELMELRKEDVEARVQKMAKLAKESVSEGGSSWFELERLIEDIRSNNL